MQEQVNIFNVFGSTCSVPYITGLLFPWQQAIFQTLCAQDNFQQNGRSNKGRTILRTMRSWNWS